MNKRTKKKQTRKRKRDLVAPICAENCQINHTIEQTAALLQLSIWQTERLVYVGRLPFIECGLGLKKKSRRIPHAAIRNLQRY